MKGVLCESMNQKLKILNLPRVVRPCIWRVVSYDNSSQVTRYPLRHTNAVNNENTASNIDTMIADDE